MGSIVLITLPREYYGSPVGVSLGILLQPDSHYCKVNYRITGTLGLYMYSEHIKTLAYDKI